MDQKITGNLQQAFTSIIKNPSPQTLQELMTFSNRVFNSLIGTQTNETTQILKQKCLEKSSQIYNGDSKPTLKCTELLTKILGSRTLNSKESALKLLLKLADNQNLATSTVYVANAFQTQAMMKQQLDITSTSIRQDDHKNFKEKYIPQKLAIVRNRGSPEQGASENQIIREILFAMQNIQGNLFVKVDDFQTLKPSLNVKEPVKKMAMELAELGWLYKKIITDNQQIGQVRFQFKRAIQFELDQYYRWVAIVESLLKQDELNLRKLVIWSIEPFERLKWIALLCQAVQPYRGTKIISIINSYRPHGTVYIMQLMNRTLLKVISPLFKFIEKWVQKGQLWDTHGQFFIQEDSKIGSDSFWQKKYKFIEQNVPNIVGIQNARIVFNIGKTINFLKHCCRHEYQLSQPFLHQELILDPKSSSITFSYQFTQWLNGCSNIVNKDLMSVLFNKFKLKDHLDAVKRFLLMGQGDFIEILLDTLGQQLNKTPSMIYKHNLNSKLEKALASSNAQYLQQDITGRVNVETILHGSDGWDNFFLTYAVDEPINILLTPKIMRQGYMGIFGFLWKLKRVQRALKSIWINHTKEISKTNNNKKQTDGEGMQRVKKTFNKFQNLFQRCCLLRTSMQHFISSLLSYIMLTIQASFNKFMESIQTATRFDQVLKLHEQLVLQLREICFLQSRNKNIQSVISNLFDQIFKYRYRQDSLLQTYESFKEIAKKVALQQRINKKFHTEGKGLGLDYNENIINDSINDSFKRTSENMQQFQKYIQNLMILLQKQGEKYTILLLRVDFNEHFILQSHRKLVR